jgi:hypothetical protein
MATVPTFALPPSFLAIERRGTDASFCIAGIPFEIGTTNRSGARFGPAAIRQWTATIQEIEVEQLNKRSARRHLDPVEPIYVAADAVACLERFRPVPYATWLAYRKRRCILRPLSLSETHARIYWWCSPPRTGIASVRPTICTGRGIGVSLCSDKCVRVSL